MASVFIVDVTFVCDVPNFISGSILSLSAMIALAFPHVNILSKCDWVNEAEVESILDVESASVLWQREEYNREKYLAMQAVAVLAKRTDGEREQHRHNLYPRKTDKESLFAEGDKKD